MSVSERPVSVTRIPDPAEPVPPVAWPTVLLLLGAIVLLAGSTALAVSGAWPMWLSVLPNAVAIYLLFTVAHDASHHAASSEGRLNLWVGRLATTLFAPQMSFEVWRFIHMQHHRFTNHDDGADPDHYTMDGPSWQRLPRLVTLDAQYIAFYFKHAGARPRKERLGLIGRWALLAVIAVGLVVAGYGVELLVLFLIPQRIALIWLAFAFDYLPHSGLHLTPREDRLKTTRNRIGGERWLTPLLLYQNYHLVHHLHPTVPFYRYLAVWRRNEDRYLEGDPALSTARGRPITADEYRRMRELAEH
jgi:ring-1,2-phenylacetyl-CoA epoxidase subunit PaaE